LIIESTIPFSGIAKLAPGAIELAKQSGGGTGPVHVKMDSSLRGNGTVVRLMFSNRRRALGDGKYQLIIHGDRVHDSLGRRLDGDSNGLPGGDLLIRFRVDRGQAT
jgi:hypothetical protein